MAKRSRWAGEPWLRLTADDLRIEARQCSDEGKDISTLSRELDVLAGLDLEPEENQRRSEEMLDRTASLPAAAGYRWREPSELSEILALRPAGPALPGFKAGGGVLFDKALGGWLGRCCGCLLGKPVEGRTQRQQEKFLRGQGRFPLSFYFSRKAGKPLAEECRMNLEASGVYAEDISRMPEDDDTNYTVAGLAILEWCGIDFTSRDAARFWLRNIPVFRTCTAERVAYRNLVFGIPPPESASFRNPYREWIGAQIRADAFGYVNPGAPSRAAEFAWRDGAVSHVKNGIYGEMWVAAMLAAAYVCDDAETVLFAGLAQVPAECRLSAGVRRMISLRSGGKTLEEAVADIHGRWNEAFAHDWCHVISNAEIVAAALLWGEKDFGRTVCAAVSAGFDTDCNGATAGSVLGVILGASLLPAEWIKPLNDSLETGVAGYNKVSLTDMARRTAAFAAACRGRE